MKIDGIKDLLPLIIRRPIGKLRAVLRRLKIWGLVSARISGAGEDDRKELARSIRRAPITVWKNLEEWQFPMVQKDCTVVSHEVGVFNVRAGTDDLFHVLPGQEPAVEQAIRDLLRPGDTFVDAGSNIGFYTILAAQIVGENGVVIACEMMPETAAILRGHVTLNDTAKVTVFEGALSDTSGEIIYASHPDGKHGQASIARLHAGPQLAVQTRTLESILESTECVRVIKMDLEGAELKALIGLGESLSKLEFLVFENRGAPEVVTWLQERSFEVTRLDGNNALAQRKTPN